MARRNGSEVNTPRVRVLISLFIINLISAPSLFAQATPWYEADGFRSTNGNPEYSRPNTWSPPIPPVNGNLPGPYVRPTEQDTRRFIDSNPSLRSLDPSLKATLIYNLSNPWLNSPILPNGATNPLYQNGQITPNWYVPSTWSSRVMNWHGVQQNGFLPSTVTSTYNPSSVTTIYNPSSGYNPSSSTYHPPSQPSLPSASQYPRQTNNLGHVNTQTRFATEVSRPLGPSPGDVAKAIENHERALSLHEAAGDKVAQVTDHVALARLLVRDDKPEQAVKHLGDAEQMSQTIDNPKLQRDLLNIKGAAYMSLGDFEQSIVAYRQAMKIVRSLNDEDGQAEIYTSTGWAFQSLGQARNALACYEAALSLFIKVGNKDGEVRTRLGIGSLYRAMGEFSKATDQYMKAVPNASKDQYARMLVSVAEILQSRNQPTAALARYEKALSLSQPTGDITLEAAILAGIGRCHMALGSYLEARYDFERARVSMKETGNRAGEAGIIASIGELNYWTAISSPTNPSPRFKDALRGYNEALTLMRAVGDRAGEIGVLTNTGLVFDAWGNSHEALSYYMQALAKMDELQTSSRLEEFRIDLAEQSARLYQRAAFLETSLHRMEEAFDLSERARARTFLDQLGNNRINPNNHLPTDFSAREEKLRGENILLQRQLGQELAKPGPDVNPERMHSLQSRLSTVRREYEDAINELKLSNPEYASFLSIAPLTLREAQQQLGSDVTVVSYFTTPDMTLAFVLTRDSFHVSKLSATEGQLAFAVTTLLDFSSQRDAPTSLKSLHKWLIAPIKSHLKTSMLAFVPYGILHDLPFAALTPDGKRYLGDEYAVFSLPSVSVLPYIRARMKPIGNSALVLANDEGEGLPHLSHAYDEAQAVASLFVSKPLLGDAATASVLQSRAGDYEILHLIAHIDHDDQNPEFTRIILGQGRDKEGPLALDQVLGLDLRKTSMVVLSGCQSQKGKRSRGDDVIGLSRAFIYAGTPSVVASLWSVDDDATRQLMIAFYTHLKDGLSKAEALRAAQIDVRHKYPHPYYWAGFVLTGDPGQAGTFNLLASSK